MTDAVPRPRPPHLHREITRHGKAVWYVRVGRDRRIRIKAEYGTPEFEAAYQAALTGERQAPRMAGTPAGSFAWLIKRYREAPAWTALSLATRRQRENILRQVIENAGRKPFSAITEATIAAGRDRRGKTPFQARHFLDTMRGLFAWAKEAGFVKIDPAALVKYPTLKEGEGFPAWTLDDVRTYEGKWPLGTRQRVWLAALLHTGLRRGDVVRLGRQHVRDGIARLRTEKTDTDVSILLTPPLIEALAAGPTGDLTYICGANGRPLTKESFGNDFAEACRAAGIRKSAHGLRKLAAVIMAHDGASLPTLNAVFGWTGSKMALRYTDTAERERLAIDAWRKRTNDSATSIPAPEGKVRVSGKKI